MKDSMCLNFCYKVSYSDISAKKKNVEGLAGFRKSKIEYTFVDIDSQLKQLAEIQDFPQVRRFVHDIRNQLFELYNDYVYHFDVRKFANCEPGAMTPLNSEC